MLTQGQWWSIRAMHRPQIEQGWDAGGLMLLHFLHFLFIKSSRNLTLRVSFLTESSGGYDFGTPRTRFSNFRIWLYLFCSRVFCLSRFRASTSTRTSPSTVYHSKITYSLLQPHLLPQLISKNLQVPLSRWLHRLLRLLDFNLPLSLRTGSFLLRLIGLALVFKSPNLHILSEALQVLWSYIWSGPKKSAQRGTRI